MKVGFVGLGLMGSGMAASLLKAPSFQTRIQHFKKGERDHQSWWQIHPTRTILATHLLALSGLTN